jgi:pyrophosphatase PpaX
MIKAVLFDLDGTLINTNNLILQSFKYAFRKGLDLEVEDSEIIKLFGEPLTQALKKYGEENLEGLIGFFREFNEKKHDELAVEYKGVEEALRELRAGGVKIAVVTSKRRPMALRSMQLIKIVDYMDVIITPEDTEKHKPDGAPALKACELLKIRPEEAIMVGDSIYDILCGKNAGCSTAVVSYSEFSREELLRYTPDYIIDSLTALPKILKGQGSSEAV